MPDVFISDSRKNNKKEVPPVPVEVPKRESQRINIEGHTHNKFSSFSVYPENVDFETREDNEKIVLLLRQHVIVNLKWILVTILMLMVPVIARSLNVFNVIPINFGIVINLSWYLITFAYALENFLSWYFNVYLVTTDRVIDVDFYSLIYKQVSDANLDKIQDVTYNMGGVARTIFNYGNVFVQTAAEVSEFEFLAVPNPDRVVKIIQELSNKKEKND